MDFATPEELKRQAAELERQKKPDQALARYRELLAYDDGSGVVDVTLRNRIGDLFLRVGHPADAIKLFEKSADEYAQLGFLSNSIALCNKILRAEPHHLPTLRRLARYSAEKGIIVDAQRYYLLVAEQLEADGNTAESLQALDEFAKLSPDDAHVRSIVVQHLLRAGRQRDALPHLSALHRLHTASGRTQDAEAVAHMAVLIDEHWTPSAMARAVEEDEPQGPALTLISPDDDFLQLEAPVDAGTNSDYLLTLLPVEGFEPTSPTNRVPDDPERRQGGRDRRSGGDRRQNPGTGPGGIERRKGPR